LKASYIVQEVLDERGRYISSSEFKWLMNTFKDRYDPRRLSFALCYVAGLRSKDGVRARLKWFSKDFTEMKMAQCKGNIRKKDGVVHIKNKPRYVPLPEWLANDLRNFRDYRLMLGWYVGEKLEDFRLFPKLKSYNLNRWIQRLRENHSEEASWLKDVWLLIKGYDRNKNLIWTKKWYRVAPHAGRANYVTCSYEATGRDLMATKVLSGHDQTKDVEKYIKVSGIMEKKQEVKEKYMDNLVPEQKIPLLVGQTRLERFNNKV
jgi:integrase